MFRDMKRGVRTEDEFQSLMQKGLKYIVRHRETSIWVGVVLLAVVVGGGYMLSKGEGQSAEADLMQTQAVGLITQQKFPEAENILTELSTKYGSTRPGKVALYYLGVLYFYRSEYEEARDNFSRFLSRVKSDFLLTPSALFGAGSACEGLKEYDKALQYYLKIPRDDKSPFYLYGLLACGRVYGILGDREKAQEYFDKLLAQKPPSDLMNDAKFYKGYFNQ